MIMIVDVNLFVHIWKIENNRFDDLTIINGDSMDGILFLEVANLNSKIIDFCFWVESCC